MKSFLLLLIVSCTICNTIQAQYNLVNNAVVGSAACGSNQCYQLTTTAASQRGAVWSSAFINLTQSFDYNFCLNLGSNDGGADGMVFVLQRQSNTAVGTNGGTLGYDIFNTASVAVEFDTWDNGPSKGDIPADHISLNYNANQASPIVGPVQASTTSTNIEDGQNHIVRITWSAPCNVLNVYFDGQLRITRTQDLVANVFGGNPNVYWGFTATTGAATNVQSVCFVNLQTSTYQAPTITASGATTFCQGGTVSLTANNGTSYIWSGGTSTNTATTIVNTSGTYTATVTNANGCTGTVSQTVTVNPNPVPVIASVPTCDSVNVTVTPTGMTSYQWTGGNTPNSINNTFISNGTYTVTITDGNTCVGTASTTVSLAPTIVLTVAQTDSVSCSGGSDGKAQASPSGGVQPYQYIWDTGGSSTDINVNLNAGTHTVTVSDANGCTRTASVIILEPLPLLGSASQTTQVSCFSGTDGAACATANDGTAPYHYIWDNGGNTACINGLIAGLHFVTVTDVNGCTATASVTITEPVALTAAAMATDSVSCFGGSNGIASVTPSGGTLPYSYAWDMGSGNPNNALNAGIHTVTVTDANSCQTTAQVVIREPLLLALSATMIDSVKCFGGNTGVAEVLSGNVSGGTAPYSYTWDMGGSTTSIGTGLNAGTHTVTVVDAHACSASATVVILEPLVLSAIASEVHGVSCPNNTDGQASVTVNGGTQPYHYLWLNNNTAPNPIDLAGGTQTVVVTDVHGCTITASTVISVPSALSVTAMATDSVSCNGGFDGKATAVAVGGTPNTAGNYTFIWDGTISGDMPTTLSVGLHTVVVTDANGCTANSTVTILEPLALSAVATTLDSVSCGGQADGKATVTVINGTPPYHYLWDNTSPLQNPVDLAAGTHVVTVTDVNGCSTTTATTVYQPIPVTVSVIQTDSVSCQGGTDGKAQVNVNGGTAPYTFAWDNNLGVGPAPTTLPAGTHTVTVTDVNGCTTIAQVVINEPAGMTANIALFAHVSCFGGNDGNATVSVTGGSLPYHYLWSDPNSQTGAVATDLSAGTYSVEVTDFGGCAIVASVTITEPIALAVSLNVTNVLCYGAFTGSIATTTNGGTPGYNYSWSDGNGQVTPVANSLPRGAYTVTVTDSHNCSVVRTANVTEPPLLTASVTHTDVTCNGFTTGTASVNPIGGVGPYTFNWSGSLGGFPSVSNLSAGVYIVTITDANNCIATGSAQVQEPSPINISITVNNNVNCNGGANGSATANIIGGVLPYTILWNDPSATITPNPTSLLVGTYTIQVTDANGCNASSSVYISEPTAIDFSLTQQPVKCFGGNNGSATVIPGGGTGAYTYNWSTLIPQNTSTATGLTAGVYTVTITDASNCTITGQIDVLEYAAINLQITSDSVRCNGESTGALTVTATGGFVGTSGGYAYNWSGSGQITPRATNLVAGVYTVTVTDANGCTKETTGEVFQLSPLNLTVVSQAVRCFGQNNGRAFVTATGGAAGAYHYLWNSQPQQITDTLRVALAGTYMVTVSDRNGCSAVGSTTITQPDQLLTTLLNMTPVSCKGGSDGELETFTQGGVGSYTYDWATTPPQLDYRAVSLSAGSYVCTVTDGNGCFTTFSGDVTEPAQEVSATTIYTESSCYGGSDGTATVLPAGGTVTATAGYTYLWLTNNQQLQTATGLSAGLHTVIVTDTKGCTALATAIVREPSPISVIFPTSNMPTCKDGRDGSATVLAAGGTPSYIYNWSTIPALTGASVTGLQGNANYTVTATDIKGCTGTGQVHIDNPLGITLQLSSQSAGCFNSATGSATVVANGGTPTYAYHWSDALAQATPTATALTAGTYYVTVTDQNGCTAATNTTILQSSTLNIRTTVKNVSCSGESDGIATVIATGGSPLYTYSWTGGSVSPSYTQIPAGTYTVTVTDSNNCSAITSVVVLEPPVLTLTPTKSDVHCFGSRDGRINLAAIGGTMPYQYSYNNGNSYSGNSTLVGIQAGTYTVLVRDKNGCTSQGIIYIDEPQQLLVDAGPDQQVEYGDEVDLVATTTATAGTATFVWTTTPTDTSLTLPTTTSSIIGHPLADTYYKVVVTDPNGCKAHDEVLVTVNAKRRVFVANAITPNGDKINDVLYVQGGPGTERITYFRVYDRWGELVYEAKDAPLNDPKYGWDGTLNGQLMDSSAFIWTAEVKFEDGQTLIYKGDVSLLR